MFICNNCKKSQPTGAKPVKRVLETRPRNYFKLAVERLRDGSLEERSEYQGSGFETVKEVDLCRGCAVS